MQQCMSLEYEPSSEPLHISAKQLFLKAIFTFEMFLKIIGLGWGFRAPEDEEMDAELAGNHETPECRVQGAGSRVQGLGSRVQGLGCRVNPSWSRVEGKSQVNLPQVSCLRDGICIGVDYKTLSICPWVASRAARKTLRGLSHVRSWSHL
jgi:hypothetical protein